MNTNDTNQRMSVSELRRAMPDYFRRFLDHFEDAPGIGEAFGAINRDHLAYRTKLCNDLAAVQPAYKKRVAESAARCNKAVAVAEAAAIADRDAKADLRAALGEANGLERVRDVEADTLERLLRAGAAPVIRDAKEAVQSLSLNAYIPDLSTGTRTRAMEDGGDRIAWGQSPEFKRADGLDYWHAARNLQSEVLGLLAALELQPISDSDAAEEVTALLRRLSAATHKIQAPGLELQVDGSVVVFNPFAPSRERRVFPAKPVQTASLPAVLS